MAVWKNTGEGGTTWRLAGAPGRFQGGQGAGRGEGRKTERRWKEVRAILLPGQEGDVTTLL